MAYYKKALVYDLLFKAVSAKNAVSAPRSPKPGKRQEGEAVEIELLWPADGSHIAEEDRQRFPSVRSDRDPHADLDQ